MIELSVPVSELADHLKWVAAHVPTRPAVPVLAGIRLTLTENRLTLDATDYDTWASASVQAQTTGEGAAVLPGRLLAGLVGKLPADQDLYLQVEGACARLRCGPVDATLRTLAADEYPDPPERPAEIGQCQATDLASAVARVAPAVAHDEALPILCCIHLATGQEGLDLAATDRYRVGADRIAWTPTIDTTHDQEGMLVPANPLARAVKGLDGALTLGAEGGLLSLLTPDRQVLLRLGDQEFPKVNAFCAAAREHAAATVTVDTGAVRAAVERARLFAGAGMATIQVEVDQHGMTVRGGSEGDLGAETIPATVEGQTGDGAGFAVQASYLTEALAAARSATATITVPAGHKPILTTGHSDSDQGWHVFMPVRLAGR